MIWKCTACNSENNDEVIRCSCGHEVSIYANSDPREPDIPKDESMFYVVSANKLTVLNLSTLGIYQLYWYYKNWSIYRSTSKEDIWPIARAMFSIFFIHSLLRLVYDKIINTAKSIKVDPRSYATPLVVLILISNTLDRLSNKSIGSPYTDIASIAILIPLTLQFRQVQIAINFACDDSDGASNREFTAANYAWIVIGLILWGLAIWGIAA